MELNINFSETYGNVEQLSVFIGGGGQNIIDIFDYEIKIHTNGNILIHSKRYCKGFSNNNDNILCKSQAKWKYLLKIEDNVPIPEHYLNIIKILLSSKPTAKGDMDKIIDVIKEIKDKIKKDLLNTRVIDLSLDENSRERNMVAKEYLLKLKIQEKENIIKEKENEIKLFNDKLSKVYYRFAAIQNERELSINNWDQINKEYDEK
jgi:hypothetical protein